MTATTAIEAAREHISESMSTSRTPHPTSKSKTMYFILPKLEIIRSNITEMANDINMAIQQQEEGNPNAALSYAKRARKTHRVMQEDIADAISMMKQEEANRRTVEALRNQIS